MENEKIMTIGKTGYSCGVYGCSNEYFNIFIKDGSKSMSFNIKGMYGIEDRIADMVKTYNVTVYWLNTFYGKVSSRDSMIKYALYENEAIEKIKSFLEQ